MKMRLRHSNNVDLAKTFIASLRGGGVAIPIVWRWRHSAMT